MLRINRLCKNFLGRYNNREDQQYTIWHMANQQELSLERKHANNGLFSDYYLNERVGAQLNNDIDLLNEAQAVFRKLKALREQVYPETLDEAQLETEWIQPVLRLLGHSFKVQIKVRYRERGNRRPYYLFMSSDDDAHALTGDIREFLN